MADGSEQRVSQFCCGAAALGMVAMDFCSAPRRPHWVKDTAGVTYSAARNSATTQVYRRSNQT